MCSGRGDWALLQPGFPIRIYTDQSLVGSFPWLFAATHVLHRHLAPRHPPLSLHSLGFLLALFSRCSCSLCGSQRAIEVVRTSPPEGGAAGSDLTSRGAARRKGPSD